MFRNYNLAAGRRRRVKRVANTCLQISAADKNRITIKDEVEMDKQFHLAHNVYLNPVTLSFQDMKGEDVLPVGFFLFFVYFTAHGDAYALYFTAL